MPARLLIDGYNLLHASSVFASAAGPPTLERNRNALLEYLANSLERKKLARTTIVFDATQAPLGLPHQLRYAEMEVLFSRRGQDADELIEDLLEAAKAPREVLVVSSDHRVQRAARQHGAASIDSEIWFRELEALRQARAVQLSDAKPNVSNWESSQELQAWLKEFGDVNLKELEGPGMPKTLAAQKTEPPEPPNRKTKSIKPKEPASDEKPAGQVNPFPPGYGEDLLE